MNRGAVTGALAFLCLGALLVGVATGAAGWRSDVFSGLAAGDEILTELRAPRVLLAALTGASLGLAGVCMQSVLRNHLADPYVLGVAGGASAGAVTTLALWPGLPPGPAAALGAALATALVRTLARAPHDPTRLLLGGVAVGAVLASFTGLVLVLAPGERLLRSATTSLGTDPRRLRRVVLGAGIVLTALAVAAGGLIGFVGLIAPHGARRLVGSTHRGVVPVAALLGALLVVLADAAARTTFAPREVPVGLLTALLGGPLFLWLLGRRPTWA
jgi:iron complex transport system permease protein